MDKGVVGTVIVAIVAAAASVITTQIQETIRFEAAIAERREELRSSLILTAIATPVLPPSDADEDDENRGEVQRQAAAETLRFFAAIGLLEDNLGGAEIARRVEEYIAEATDESGAIAAFPSLLPGTPLQLDSKWVLDYLRENRDLLGEP